MNTDNPDTMSMLLGLHRLGDCRLPELHDLIANRCALPSGNVMLFPAWRTRRPNACNKVAAVPAVILQFPCTAMARENRRETA